MNPSFLTFEQEEQVIKAIQKAEKNTSGEIRVHIESTSKQSPLERAIEVFNELEMEKTKARNGVLFYLCTTSKEFAILGDKGIDTVVPTDFWDETKNLVLEQFKKGDFTQGLIDGITAAGRQLKTYFDYQDDDENELPNTISKN